MSMGSIASRTLALFNAVAGRSRSAGSLIPMLGSKHQHLLIANHDEPNAKRSMPTGIITSVAGVAGQVVGYCLVGKEGNVSSGVSSDEDGEAHDTPLSECHFIASAPIRTWH